MQGSLLNADLLTENIHQIEYYRDEEQNSLQKICSKLEDCKGHYHSDNILFFSKISTLESLINPIEQKRSSYTTVLRSAIDRHQRLVEETKRIFDREEEII